LDKQTKEKGGSRGRPKKMNLRGGDLEEWAPKSGRNWLEFVPDSGLKCEIQGKDVAQRGSLMGTA